MNFTFSKYFIPQIKFFGLSRTNDIAQWNSNVKLDLERLGSSQWTLLEWGLGLHKLIQVSFLTLIKNFCKISRPDPARPGHAGWELGQSGINNLAAVTSGCLTVWMTDSIREDYTRIKRCQETCWERKNWFSMKRFSLRDFRKQEELFK